MLLYHLNKATSTTYTRRGGASGNSFGCGFVFADLSNAFGAANWHFGAALSFKLYETFYCDYFYQSSGTKYTVRGGYSGSGANCGDFYVSANSAASYTSWTISASISFK